MTIDRMNVSGAWFGSYAYLGGDRKDVSFIATLEEVAGLVTGETSEHVELLGLEVAARAILRGHRSGEEVGFTKAYDGAGPLAHAVDYAGTLSDDGRRIAGAWQMEGAMGSFEMRREIVEAAAEELVEAAVPVEGMLER